MTLPRSADDRPDPADQHAVHARVPEHVSRGVFSTGVIVMTAPTEFVIDFIQNLGRPHQVVARVIMPHPVMPQFVDALLKNIELYRGRYGNLPQPNVSSVLVTHASGPVASPAAASHASKVPGQATSSEHALPADPLGPQAAPTQAAPGAIQPRDKVQPGDAAQPGDAVHGGVAAPLLAGSSALVGAGLGDAAGVASTSGPGNAANEPGQSGPPAAGQAAAGTGGHGASQPDSAAGSLNQRRASAQEIYDDLKLRDDIHSGSYANAVMIGHGPHEFSFDFITNFYPQSAVSARVFLAAGQVARLAESLRGAWEQIRHRFQPPPGGENPQRQ